MAATERQNPEEAEFDEEVEVHLLRLRARAEAKRRYAAETDDPEDVSAPLYTDVAALMDGGLPESPKPEVLTRSDGVKLFYRGEVNILFGDPEHGKTWVALAAAAEELIAGGKVLFVDLDHNGAESIITNLLLFGVPKEVVGNPDRFRHYEHDNAAMVVRVVADCAPWCPDVVVVDSSGELLPLFAASSDNADDFTRVHNRILQPLAMTGAAVLLIDHLAKQQESRRQGPGGSMAKRRTVGGLSLRVVREQPFVKGRGGAARLMINKDRHGGVRENCPLVPAGRDTEQLAGTFLLEADDDGETTWRVAPPVEGAESSQEFRPTVLMERASKLIEENPGGFTRNQVAENTPGRKEHVRHALALLEAEEYVTTAPGHGGHPRCSSVRPYRQADDPRSDQHMPARRADAPKPGVDHGLDQD